MGRDPLAICLMFILVASSCAHEAQGTFLFKHYMKKFPMMSGDFEPFAFKGMLSFVDNLESKCPMNGEYKDFFEKLKGFITTVNSASGSSSEFQSQLKGQSEDLFKAISKLSTKAGSSEDTSKLIENLMSMGKTMNEYKRSDTQLMTPGHRKELVKFMAKWAQGIGQFVKTVNEKSGDGVNIDLSTLGLGGGNIGDESSFGDNNPSSSEDDESPASGPSGSQSYTDSPTDADSEYAGAGIPSAGPSGSPGGSSNYGANSLGGGSGGGTSDNEMTTSDDEGGSPSDIPSGSPSGGSNFGENSSGGGSGGGNIENESKTNAESENAGAASEANSMSGGSYGKETANYEGSESANASGGSSGKSSASYEEKGSAGGGSGGATFTDSTGGGTMESPIGSPSSSTSFGGKNSFSASGSSSQEGEAGAYAGGLSGSETDNSAMAPETSGGQTSLSYQGSSNYEKTHTNSTSKSTVDHSIEETN